MNWKKKNYLTDIVIDSIEKKSSLRMWLEVCISSIFLLIVNLEIDSITAKPYRKADFNEFVQNYLCCDMGMIIFDLHGYGGC